MTTDDAARLVAEHIAPADVVAVLDPTTCPYCRAYPTVPCAHHQDRR